MNLGLSQGPLVRTTLLLFLYVLNSPLMMFLRLMFSNQKESNPKVVDFFQYFGAHFEVWNLRTQFQNQFYSFTLYSPLLLQSLLLALQHDQTRSHG